MADIRFKNGFMKKPKHRWDTKLGTTAPKKSLTSDDGHVIIQHCVAPRLIAYRGLPGQ